MSVGIVEGAQKCAQDFSSDRLHACINEAEMCERMRKIIDLAGTLDDSSRKDSLLKAISFIDLTSLRADDTASSIETLCKQAMEPLKFKHETFKSIHTAAVCVYPLRVEDAVNSLKNLHARDNIRVASVAAGFPSGQYPLSTRLGEIQYAVGKGADEIDVVINRSLAVSHKWEDLYLELISMRTACKDKCMKTILATGELQSLSDIYSASMVAMMAGSNFIKTSTGKEAVNATLLAGAVMCRAIKDYYRWTGRKVGFKPAGGIKTAEDILQWVMLVREELGERWLDKNLFRIGASGVLNDIACTLKTILSVELQLL